jgi:hypothetical protein
MAIEINAVKPDRSRVDLEDDAVLRHWMKTLQATREQIEAAIEKVGADPATVRKELARRRLDKSGHCES